MPISQCTRDAHDIMKGLAQKEINHAQSVNARVDAIRTGASKQERRRIGAVERSRRTDK